MIGDWDVESAKNCELLETTSLCADPPISIRVDQISMHPDFNNTGKGEHDIALIKLERPIMAFTGEQKK